MQGSQIRKQSVLFGSVALGAASLFSLSSATHADTCTIVTGGKPQAAIVIADKSFPVDSMAANELQYHIEKASGAKLPIYRESQRPATATSTIYIGNCKESERHGLHPDRLAFNASETKTIGSDLFFAGNDGDGAPLQDSVRSGSLFAVYNFLENELGVRWLWPGKLGEVVPSRKDIAANNLNESYAPKLIHTRFRLGTGFAGPAEAWADRRSYSQFVNDEVLWMRRHHFARSVSLDMKHAFTGYWARFGNTHPDYFNLLPDGTRRSDPLYVGGAPEYISMNVSDSGLWRQLISDWKAHRTEFDHFIDASEDDTWGKDLTPESVKLDVPDPRLGFPWDQRVERAKQAFANKELQWPLQLGSLSDRYARFWLTIQMEAQKEDPNAIVMGIAAWNYVEPPLKTNLNGRIIVGLVPPVEVPYSQEMRKEFRRVWDGWANTGVRLVFRPNIFLNSHNMPVFYARQLGEDLAHAYQHHMVGTDYDSLTGQWATQGPNLYVAGRMTEHPDWPVDRILNEYYDGFGPAKAEVRAYFAHWEHVTNQVKKRMDNPFEFYQEAPRIFTSSVMAEGSRLLEEARSAAGNDTVARERVAFLELGLQHAKLTLATETARKRGNNSAFQKALTELDAFRAQHEKEGIADMGFLQIGERSARNRTGAPVPSTTTGKK